MAFTNGSLYGIYDGQAAGSSTNSAWNGCNSTNPNLQPVLDIFQILSPGGGCLLQVTAGATVNTNVGVGSFTKGVVLAQYQLSASQYTGLVAISATPSASQICQAAFPLNFAAQKLDIFQIATQIATINVAGGGGVIWRLTYNGVGSTT